MATLRFPKGSKEYVSDNFQACEFDCHCTEKSCTETLINDALIFKLQDMRNLLGRPLRIESGYRCEVRQRQLKEQGYETANGISTHQQGRACDVYTGHHVGLDLEKAARRAGFKAIGIGRMWIHVDTRDGRERRWDYNKR